MKNQNKKFIIGVFLVFVLLTTCLCGWWTLNYFQQTTTNPTESVLATTTVLVSPTPNKNISSLNNTVQATGLIVTFLDVGQGDAILLHSSADNQYALIDGGDDQGDVWPYLQAHGIQHLNFILITHPHVDHIGGLVPVLKNVKTDLVYFTAETTTKTFENVLLTMKEKQVLLKRVSAGAQLPFSRFTLDVLNPTTIDTEEMNNNSAVTRLVVNQNLTFLFMGDAEKKVEQELLQRQEVVQATIIKLGHHASTSSSSESFLKAVHPSLAIYTAGVGNKYGHPHAATLELLEKLGISVLGTLESGDITINTDGETYQVTTSGK